MGTFKVPNLSYNEMQRLLLMLLSGDSISTNLDDMSEDKVLSASVGKQIKELVSNSVEGLVSDNKLSEAIKGFVTQTIVDKIVADAVKDLAKSSDLEGLVTEEELNEALDNFTPSGGGNIGSNLDEDAQEIFSIAFLTNGSMGLQYQLQDGLACFNGIGTCIDEDIRIGSMIKGIPVKRMDDTIFNGSTVKSIFIPKSVEAIDGEEQYNPIFEDCLFLERIIVEENNEVYRSTNQSVLYNRQSERLVRCPQCTKNELIIVPDSILTIGIGAFTRVINVTAIYISENLQSVEAEAFNDNPTLTDIFWSGTERSWRSLFVDQGNEAFENATKHYMGYLEYVEHSNYFACTGIGEYTGDKIVIPSATEGYPEKPVLEIGNNANTFDRATFTGAENLTSVALTDRIELIRPGAFYGCSNLQQVVLGDGVVAIGRSAFEGTGISDITLTQNVDDIDGQAFRNCTQLKKIVITNRDRVINLHATSAFANTPIDNDTGEIFVYKKLLSKYRNATNWSVYASVIKAIEDHPEVLERGIKWQ